MKWPRVRFTVRRIMVLVAVVAVVLGASSAYRRSTYCRYAADDCALAERQHRFFASFHEMTAKQHRSLAEVDRERVRTAESESAREVSAKSQFWDEQVITSESRVKGLLAKAERAATLHGLRSGVLAALARHPDPAERSELIPAIGHLIDPRRLGR